MFELDRRRQSGSLVFVETVESPAHDCVADEDGNGEPTATTIELPGVSSAFSCADSGIPYRPALSSSRACSGILSASAVPDSAKYRM